MKEHAFDLKDIKKLKILLKHIPKLWSVSVSCVKDKTQSAEVAIFQKKKVTSIKGYQNDLGKC